jgi:hypothetical protein
MTVISTDGASQVTKNAAANVTQGLELASDLLGIDLAAMFQGLAANVAGNGSDSGTGPDAVIDVD